MKKNCLFLIVITLILLSCDNKGKDPLQAKSGGLPFEVELMCYDKECEEILDSLFSEKDTSLPQAEPYFDVSIVPYGQLNQITKMARNIVIVNRADDTYSSTTLDYEKNPWANPQMVVYINTPSVAAFKRDVRRLGRVLIDLFERQEMNSEISTLKASSSSGASKEVKDMFGWDIKIPKELSSTKKGKDFLWFSNDANSGMRNICVYSYSGDKLEPSNIVAKRDSIMKENIPGEAPKMYMKTLEEPLKTKITIEKGDTILIARGLWEMQEDAMGGPFVLHAIVDKSKHKVIVAESFIYAPEMKKRNLLRKDEAALYTLKKANQ